jgi:hypothetical protein
LLQIKNALHFGFLYIGLGGRCRGFRHDECYFGVKVGKSAQQTDCARLFS